jgi:hypothetical protein
MAQVSSGAYTRVAAADESWSATTGRRLRRLPRNPLLCQLRRRRRLRRLRRNPLLGHLFDLLVEPLLEALRADAAALQRYPVAPLRYTAPPAAMRYAPLVRPVRRRPHTLRSQRGDVHAVGWNREAGLASQPLRP